VLERLYFFAQLVVVREERCERVELSRD
jgi:hypothetical protein